MAKRTGPGKARDAFRELSAGVRAMRDDREGPLDLRREWVEPAVVYQLRVTLLETDPPIWRRLRIAGDTSLARLDRIIQIAMGWTNSHLHTFTAGGVMYADPSSEWEISVRNEQRTRLEGIAKEEGEAFIYEYDLGDSWRHQVLVEEVRVAPVAAGELRILPFSARRTRSPSKTRAHFASPTKTARRLRPAAPPATAYSTCRASSPLPPSLARTRSRSVRSEPPRVDTS
jgi:hypothetical protein